MVQRALLRMMDPEGNRVCVPVVSEEQAHRLIAQGWKPDVEAESYTQAKKRNYPVLDTVTFAGSVRFFTGRNRKTARKPARS